MSQEVHQKIVNSIFGIKKMTFYLIVIFILALFLRIIAAINLSVSADDMHFVTHAINFFSSGKLVTYDQSAGLWPAFTSIIYSIFGFTQFSSRFAAILFGSLSVIAIFLLSREFFGEKIALISAFLLAISPFHIKNTLAEMDVMVMFFVLVGMFLFVYASRVQKKRYFVLSGLFIGLAVYTKVYVLLFIPSLIIFALYKNYKSTKSILNKKLFWKLFVFIVAIFIFCIPSLTHNYLLYKDKGIMDFMYTNTLGFGVNESAQYYSWDAGWQAKHDWSGLFFGNSPHTAGRSTLPLLLVTSGFALFGDPLVFLFGIFGLIFIFAFRKQYKDYAILFILSILFILPFLASIIPLSKHFLFLTLFLIPSAAQFATEILSRVKVKFSNFRLRHLLIIILAFNLLYLGINVSSSQTHFYGESAIAQAISFKDSNIKSNDLVVVDSRFYRGRVNWMAYGKPYLEGTEFIQVANSQSNLSGEPVPIDIYFFECVSDDCGWGSISKQPEFNQSMEGLTSFFKERGNLIATISEPDRDKIYYPLVFRNKIDSINVYKATLNLKPAVLSMAKQPKNWFLYNIGYAPKESAFDYYNVYGFFSELLNKFARWIEIFALILSFLSLIYVFYLISRR